jgi:hypothetical protein
LSQALSSSRKNSTSLQVFPNPFDFKEHRFSAFSYRSPENKGKLVAGGATGAADGVTAPAGATSTAGGGQGRDGLVGQVGELVLGKDENQQGSGTGSGGTSWVEFHDHHSRSTRRTPILVASKFPNDHGNTAFLAPLRR